MINCDELFHVFPEADRCLEADECWVYGYDNSRRHALAEAVFFAREESQIIALVRWCHQHRIPLTARGLGSGTCGGCVPLQGGVVLSLERMNRILEIDGDNRLMRVEPGVTNAAVQAAAAEHGFFWAPDPSSAGYCTVGGNLAFNSAGPRAVKYGTARENTLALRAVTGDGQLLAVGTKTTKGVVGYDLTRLLIGSEGTLAIITEATLKLLPLAPAHCSLRLEFADVTHAAAAISAIMASPFTPSALEFMDAGCVNLLRQYSDQVLTPATQALLLITIDGPEAALTPAVNHIQQLIRNEALLKFDVARTAAEANLLWQTRKALSPTLRHIAPKKINEDVVVPVANLPKLIQGLEHIATAHGLTIVNFGHAGNGNLHVNLLLDPEDARQAAQAAPCLEAVFQLVLQLEGSLSGEHGVGIDKRDFVALELDPAALKLMHQLKQLFDPHAILNPLKALPLAQPPTSL